MTFFLAKTLENKLAAIAPIAGTLGFEQLINYSLKKPMPLCYIHGTADYVVNVNGTSAYASFQKMLDFFIPNNNVNSVPIVTELPDIYTYDNSTVTKFTYKNLGHSSADIVYYQINNGNHSVPGTYNNSNKDINAYDEIWAFFKTRKLSDK
jgi:poly(3-hydroxybutyrate) depolymerase